MKKLFLILISIFMMGCGTGYGKYNDYIFKQINSQPLDYKAIYIFQPNLEIKFLESGQIISKDKPLQFNNANIKLLHNLGKFSPKTKETWKNSLYNLLTNDKGRAYAESKEGFLGHRVEVSVTGKQYFGILYLNKNYIFPNFNPDPLAHPQDQRELEFIDSRHYEIKISNSILKDIDDGDKAGVYQTYKQICNSGCNEDSYEYIAWALILSNEKF